MKNLKLSIDSSVSEQTGKAPDELGSGSKLYEIQKLLFEPTHTTDRYCTIEQTDSRYKNLLKPIIITQCSVIVSTEFVQTAVYGFALLK